MADLKPGIYRHYKNLLVRVIGVGNHSETLEEMVIYEELEAHNGRPAGALWVRPLPMFTEMVTLNDQQIPRFEYIGEKQEEGR